jgi:hypothetical protein
MVMYLLEKDLNNVDDLPKETAEIETGGCRK